MATPNLLGITQSIPKTLVSQRMADTTDDVVYTCPANRAAKLTNGTLTNTSGAAVTCGLGIVPAGGTVGDGTHKVISDGATIQPNDSWSLKDYIGDVILGDGDRISVHAGTANVIDVHINGVEML